MADQKAEKATGTKGDPTLVERWLQDQQQWQRTALAYLDSMVKNDDFLVHLGNAMRGSLLAGKPYPSAAPSDVTASEAAPDDRLDRVLFALHALQGQINDLRMTLDELRAGRSPASRVETPATRKKAKPAARPRPIARRTALPKPTPKRRGRG